jgi:heme exporter protein C
MNKWPNRVFDVLLASTAVIFAYLIYNIFFVTPTAQMSAGGLAQKIFYFHFPAIFCGMFLSALFCFLGSSAYLVKTTEGRNAFAQAGAECAVVFGFLMLISGSLWAKKAWGVYWTWDPQLTLALLTVLIYLAVVVLRAFAGDGYAERRFAAALGVLGTINLPIIHYSVKKWGGNHPVVMRGGGGGLKDPAMSHAVSVGFLAMALLCIVLVWLRTEQHLLRSRVSRLQTRAAEAGDLE